MASMGLPLDSRNPQSKSFQGVTNYPESCPNPEKKVIDVSSYVFVPSRAVDRFQVAFAEVQP